MSPGDVPALSAEVAATLPEPRMDSLLLTETYASIQGESTFAGLPFVLVRTARCNLRCVWCDSEFTFRGGERRAVDEVLAEIRGTGLAHVLVTGGEPLLQPAVLPFMESLCDEGFTVLLETGGSLDIGGVDPRVHRIVDVKCPASGESARNRLENLAHLSKRDEVKFVIVNREDYDWAKRLTLRERLADRAGAVLFSPVAGDDDLRREMAAWIVEDRLPVRLQLQLHRVIWPDEDRRR